MKPGILLSSALLLLMCKVHAQSPSVISAGGGTNNTAGISLEWTMGEPLVSSASTSSKLITQGFHQPMIIISKPLQTNVATLFVTSVFPNPVQSLLNVKLNTGVKGLVSLVNLQGNVLFSEQVSSKSNAVQINMARFPPAVYLLNVRDASGKIIETHKVIKVN